MNRLTDKQIDEIIKEKLKRDDKISDKANSVFANFNPEQYTNKNIKQETKDNTRQDLNKNYKDNINNTEKNKIKGNSYRKFSRILSVAAVSLSVFLVGGSVLYFNKNDKNNFNNQAQTETETITYNRKKLVQNEKLEMSNVEILKDVQDNFVRVYMLGKRDIGINLTSQYWNEFGEEFNTTDCYKVENITSDVSDIFIGHIESRGLPYVFLLMEDGTVEYIDLHCYTNNQFYFVSTKLEGLDDVVGFEQKSRKYSYSNTDYEYVNAIRSDGLRKEIEIGEVNNWYDNEPKHYNELNQKYIDAHNKTAIPDDGKGDYTVNNITYLHVNGESKYAYFYKDSKFYRVERSNAKEECLADGVSGFVRDNPDGRISVMLIDNYSIYMLDKNIIFKDVNKQVVDEVTAVSNTEENTQEKDVNKNEVIDNNGANKDSEVNKDNNLSEKENTHSLKASGEQNYESGDYKIGNIYNITFGFENEELKISNIEVTTTVVQQSVGEVNSIKINNFTLLNDDIAAGTQYTEFSFTGTDSFEKKYTGTVILGVGRNSDEGNIYTLNMNFDNNTYMKNFDSNLINSSTNGNIILKVNN